MPGWLGTMYNHLLGLQDGRVLNTFTRRCNGVGPNPAASACQSDGYGTGLRGLLSYDDGNTMDFSRDYMVLSASDDDSNLLLSHEGCACGYGATLQLSNGVLVTPCKFAIRMA